MVIPSCLQMLKERNWRHLLIRSMERLVIQLTGSQEVIGSTPICSTFARRSELRWTQSTRSLRRRVRLSRDYRCYDLWSLSFLPAFCQQSLSMSSDIESKLRCKFSPNPWWKNRTHWSPLSGLEWTVGFHENQSSVRLRYTPLRGSKGYRFQNL